MAQKSELSLIKISDFGLSKKKDTSLLRSFVGTDCYLAPEIIGNEVKGRADPYTEKVTKKSVGSIRDMTCLSFFSGRHVELGMHPLQPLVGDVGVRGARPETKDQAWGVRADEGGYLGEGQ